MAALGSTTVQPPNVLNVVPSPALLSSSNANPSSSCFDPASARLMECVLWDLSAHFGSAALRRGTSKVVGVVPSYPSVARKSVQKARHPHVWLRSKAVRWMCPHCGVWLARGYTRQTIEIGKGKENPSAKKCATFCMRCLKQASERQSNSHSGKEASKDLLSDGKRVRFAEVSHPDLFKACKVKRRRRKRKGKENKKSSAALLQHSDKASLKRSLKAIPKGPLNHMRSKAPAMVGKKNLDRPSTREIYEPKQAQLKENPAPLPIHNGKLPLPPRLTSKKKGPLASPTSPSKHDDSTEDLFKSLGF